jgi:hypothetical protein
MALNHLMGQNMHNTPDLAAAKEGELVSRLVSEVGVHALKNRRDNPRLLRTPKVIRQQAVKEVIAHFKGHATKVKNITRKQALHPQANRQRPIKFFPKSKSRHLTTSDSICVEAKSFTIKAPGECSLYRNKSFTSKPDDDKNYVFRSMKTAPMLQPGMDTHDLKIHYTLGRWYLIIPRVEKLKESGRLRPAAPGGSVVALDPGVREFLVGYSPDGTILQVGTNTTKVLDKCLRRVARARNRKVKFVADSARMLAEDAVATPRSIRKGIRRRTKAYRRAEQKSAAVIKNLHYNAAHTLLKEWRTVVLPTTSSHHWCKGKKLESSVKLRAQMLRFGAFAQRLVQTASFYPDSRVLRLSEAYTSKQCGVCGVLNETLVGSKIFTCKPCGLEADRDAHAARNILLRALPCYDDCAAKGCDTCHR